MTFEREHAEALFDVLSHRRRRYALSYLRDANGDVATLTELAERVTAREADGRGDRHGTAATALHHVHLPKLVEAGLIDYDARSETVRYHGTELASGSPAERTAGDLS